MKFYSLVLSALCACVPTVLKAQGQNPHSHEWNGNSIVSVANSTNEDIKTAYLYNVGTGQYLNAGSYWGTVVVGYGVGMPINISKSPTFGKYRMQGPQATTEGPYQLQSCLCRQRRRLRPFENTEPIHHRGTPHQRHPRLGVC